MADHLLGLIKEHSISGKLYRPCKICDCLVYEGDDMTCPKPAFKIDGTEEKKMKKDARAVQKAFDNALGSKTPTQNDWKIELENKLSQIHGCGFNQRVNCEQDGDCEDLVGFIRQLLADARREVIDSIHGKFCEFAIQGGDDEQAQKGILLYARTLQYLATLRKEGK